MGFNVWHELNELELMATRHKRATSLKKYLLMDLKLIEERIKELRERFEVGDVNVEQGEGGSE